MAVKREMLISIVAVDPEPHDAVHDRFFPFGLIRRPGSAVGILSGEQVALFRDVVFSPRVIHASRCMATWFRMYVTFSFEPARCFAASPRTAKPLPTG
jgi:hypothetical protein